MQRLPVDSSHVRSVGHDPETLTLEVEFADGSVYRYPAFSRAEYAALLAAPSTGYHLHAHVIPRYQPRRVTAPRETSADRPQGRYPTKRGEHDHDPHHQRSQ